MTVKKVIMSLLTVVVLSLGTVSVAADSNNYSPSEGEVTTYHWMNLKTVTVGRTYNSFEEIPSSI